MKEAASQRCSLRKPQSLNSLFYRKGKLLAYKIYTERETNTGQKIKLDDSQLQVRYSYQQTCVTTILTPKP